MASCCSGGWRLFYFLTALCSLLVPNALAQKESLGIPGATQTLSGYDTENGFDPICWRSQSAAASEENNNTSLKIPNALLDDFRIDKERGVELMLSCPVGNFLWAEAPVEIRKHNATFLRTGVEYYYNVSGTVNLTSLAEHAAGVWPSVSNEQQHDHEPVVYSDNGPQVSIQILLCELGSAGFCSPFIHEEANARLAAVDEPVTVDPGDSHGGTHVHSPYSKVDLPTADGPIYKIDNIQIPVLVNQPATFYAIAALQVYLRPRGHVNHTEFDDEDDFVLLRYDMANALAQTVQRIIRYQAPADVMHVSDPVRHISHVVIGISAAVILFLLVACIKHRQHQVLRLTQGDFLICFLGAGLVAVVCSFMTEPASDAYCRYSPALIMIPLQLMYAVTVGRLWRINTVISPLLVETLTRGDSQRSTVAAIFRSWGRCLRRSAATSTHNLGGASGGGSAASIRQRTAPRKLRRQVTSQQLAKVVAACTLPQVILQIVALVVQPRELYEELNAEQSKGRVVCRSLDDNGEEVSPGANLELYGYYIFGCLVLVLLAMAHATRSLPSLFNETRVIWDSTVTTITLFILGIGVVLATNDPTTDPSVQYLVTVVLILSTALNTSLRIMLPKLQMIWHGETVIVSKLVSDHNRARASMKASVTMNHNKHTNITGLHPPPNHYHAGIATRVGSGMGPTSRQKQQMISSQTLSNTSGTNSNSVQILDDLHEFEKESESEHFENQHDQIVSNDDKKNHELHDDTATTKDNNGTTDASEQEEGDDSTSRDTEMVPLEPAQSVRFASTLSTSATTRSSNRNHAASSPSHINPSIRSNHRSTTSRLGTTTAAAFNTSTRSAGVGDWSFCVRRDEAPSRRLVLRMYSLQEKLAYINNRITTGLAPSENDWEDVRRLCHRLDMTFEENVCFEWEHQQQQVKEAPQTTRATATNSTLTSLNDAAPTPSTTATGMSVVNEHFDDSDTEWVDEDFVEGETLSI